MDEIYTCQRAEYSRPAGNFYGLEENEQCTKTLLTIMIKNVASKYQDVHVLIPITKINSSLIYESFDKILECIRQVGFDAVASIADGHSANTKFYKKLWEDALNVDDAETEGTKAIDGNQGLKTSKRMDGLAESVPIATSNISSFQYFVYCMLLHMYSRIYLTTGREN